MFWSSEASLALTHFRAYDPELGRWLSRDPLKHAEVREGPNLYAYVSNDPVNLIDPLGNAPWYKGYSPYSPGAPPTPPPAPPPAPGAPPSPPPIPEPPIPYTPSAPGPPILEEPYLPSGGGTACEGFSPFWEWLGPVFFAFDAGYRVGTGLDQTFHISGWASDNGAQAKQLLLNDGYSDAGASVLGAFTTLGGLSPASGGLINEFFP